MNMLNAFTVNATVQGMTPILLAALAGVLCGRVGVFNIALEGKILIGAFFAIAGSFYTGSALGGIAAGMLATMIFASILALGVTRFGGDSIVICIGMNLLASGLTAYLLGQMFGQSGVFSDPAIAELDRIVIPQIATVPWIGWILSRQTPITYASWVLVLVIAVILFRTPLGLRLRGIGQNPDAARTLGIDVDRTKFWTVIVAGALCGLAGAQLSIGTVGIFAEDMSAGRGWIAVVAVMLARDNPIWAAAVCLVFAFADTLSVQLQAQGLPNQLTDTVPYVITLAALVLGALRGRRRRLAPA
ncbi:ABC transporter permease [Palleronia sp. LCG004]|uniref:ABC transporter permease n=1 Tax=Palleronia sp. LCG004 TaxID=3079304 RepID=UPI002943DDDD|nr:ABC transporter permease [Palleronia sp. LCG004]WOI57786.1 ABC transporter permease [Palleronia sp. LCG004]